MPTSAPRTVGTPATDVATAESDAAGLLAAIMRTGGRWAGRAGAGFALLSVAASAAPEGLADPVAGHLSLALLLLCPQVLVIAWALTGHGHESNRVDVALGARGLS
ncbi:hypothetical protein ABZ621_32320 [Streptomyces sp. NPDC007863]|uniref:hypothetical protein n=1 Tax=Streptomyces sp. NPDC007863 TaxID=3154894 RepID=UPI0033C578AD